MQNSPDMGLLCGRNAILDISLVILATNFTERLFN